MHCRRRVPRTHYTCSKRFCKQRGCQRSEVLPRAGRRSGYDGDKVGGGQRKDCHVAQDYMWWRGVRGVEAQARDRRLHLSPQVKQRDVNPEQKVHEYDYSRIHSRIWQRDPVHSDTTREGPRAAVRIPARVSLVGSWTVWYGGGCHADTARSADHPGHGGHHVQRTHNEC